MVPFGHSKGEENGALSERMNAGESKPSRRASRPPHRLHSSPDDAIVVVVHCVYILRCADGSLYVGSTDDVELRLRRHDEGCGAVFTAQRRPVTLAYAESHPTLLSARRREAQIKRWTTAKKEALDRGRSRETPRPRATASLNAETRPTTSLRDGISSR